MSKNGHPEFYKIIDQMVEMHDKKNANYAEDGNPLSNLKACEEIGVPAHIGCFIRMTDKWSRLKELLKGKPDQVGESIKDTLLDLAVYCILCSILFDEQKPVEKSG